MPEPAPTEGTPAENWKTKLKRWWKDWREWRYQKAGGGRWT
jgi:hypothetical protein